MNQRNYLVVGGTSGIGLALTTQLSNEGHHVTVMSRTNENLSGLLNVKHIAVDVLNDEIPRDEIPQNLHGVVYCPGSITLKPFKSLKADQFRTDYELNVVGAVKVLQETYKFLRRANHASVVLFSTVAVGQGLPFHSSIAAAKGAVEGLVRSLAAEWAPQVRVNCIAPSLTDTPLAERLLSTEEKRASGAKRHPLNRVGQPEDISNMAAFLLSEKSDWITGQTIGIDGGMSTLIR